MSAHSIAAIAQELISPLTSASDRRAAAATLKTLAFDDTTFELLREANAIPALVQALRNGYASPIALLAADAVWSLSADTDNKPILLAAGAVTLLSQLLVSCDTMTPVAHSVASALCNLVDVETGTPHEVGIELLAAGGIEALVKLLPKACDGTAFEATHYNGRPTNGDAELVTLLAVTSVLAATAVNPEVCKEILNVPGDAIGRLISMLSGRNARELARHAAAVLARVANDSPAGRAAVRDAGCIGPLVGLCKAPLNRFAVSQADIQAAQHGAAALWILAADPTCRAQILAEDGLRSLGGLIGGRFGAKAEGNAAGALLALGITNNLANAGMDPNTVMAGALGKQGVVV